MAGRSHASAVDYPVHSAEAGAAGGNGGLCAGGVGHVGQREARVRTKFGSQNFAGRAVHIGQEHLSAGGNEKTGRRRAQTGAAAGDDEAMVRDLH
jgi:hypothetical protein